MYNFDSKIVHTSKLYRFQIWKTILKFFAALFIQLWNFRVFLFLTFFAKSNKKVQVTRRDNVNWGTIVKINPNTEITPFDGTLIPFLMQWMHSLVPVDDREKVLPPIYFLWYFSGQHRLPPLLPLPTDKADYRQVQPKSYNTLESPHFCLLPQKRQVIDRFNHRFIIH